MDIEPVELEEQFDVSVEECKGWLKELYATADRIRETNHDQYRKIGLLAGLLEDLITTMESEVTPAESRTQSLSKAN